MNLSGRRWPLAALATVALIVASSVLVYVVLCFGRAVSCSYGIVYALFYAGLTLPGSILALVGAFLLARQLRRLTSIPVPYPLPLPPPPPG